MGTDDVAARLAGIKERYECMGPLYQNTHFMLDAVVQDVPSLVAAVEAVLELADKWQNTPWPDDGGDRAGVATEQTILDGTALREAITSALTGKEADHG
jgi:hypothetical protein